jgi:hypothetical protein
MLHYRRIDNDVFETSEGNNHPFCFFFSPRLSADRSSEHKHVLIERGG